MVHYLGQSMFAVAADTLDAARRAAKLAIVTYEDLEPVLDIDSAMAKASFVLEPHQMTRGDAEAALEGAQNRLSGRINIGGQDHFYLEGQIAYAIPGEASVAGEASAASVAGAAGDMLVHSSTQHPTEVQHGVAKVLGVADHCVTTTVRRMGGGFGGKESQPALIAAIAALVAHHTGRPAKLRLLRDDDMVMTGKRHEFRMDYDVGFDDQGRITGITFEQAARCGYSADLSGAIADRAMFHADNCYYLDAVRITSHRCRTNSVSNTAFRGFGGPQGMVGIEQVIEEIAFSRRVDPLDIRKANLYGGPGRDVTPYHMAVVDNIAPQIIEALEASSKYRARRAQIDKFNSASPWIKKGISLTPVKFGISFTAGHLNQAGALVHVYKDGSVSLNHGGTEMGQGLFVKIAQVVAHTFQIDLDQVKITATDTSKVPNTSPTAASSGSDLNGMAARNAAIKIRDRLAAFAAQLFQASVEDVEFLPGRVRVGAREIDFKELVGKAYMARIQLSATGFYATPEIYYDRENARGKPFFYFAYGAAVSEVLVDTLTGENRVVRVDILHDCGRSLNPAIDLGQIEGGFIQGMGWLTTEELWWDERGALKTHAPSTYKIPTITDRPADMRLALWAANENPADTIYRSKAVGEPPLMLAISVFTALTHAISAVGDGTVFAGLDTPATPERILAAVDRLRGARP
ncbi:MAG: xanthine dehydrogenase molybdopterin binding subunit, partial [Alphaproteobacteria bacterium]